MGLGVGFVEPFLAGASTRSKLTPVSVKYLREGERRTTGLVMWMLGLNSVLPFSTSLLWNEGVSVPRSPYSTISPFSTCFFAISAASRSTASTSAPVNVVALATSSQKLRWSTRLRPVGRPGVQSFLPSFRGLPCAL